MLMKLAMSVVLALSSTVIVAGAAFGRGCPSESPVAPGPGGGVICITASDPGDPGNTEGGTPMSSGHGCSRADGTAVDCTTIWGTWVSSHQCYAHHVFVPANDPVWAGHSDGAVWMCALVNDGLTPDVLFWVPPGGTAAPLQDPAVLAQRALGQLVLETARVQTAPGNPNASVVGVEVWTWIPPRQWRTLNKTVTAGATSVTVRAAPAFVSWDMGPSTHACGGPGRAWTSGLADHAQTDCGYTYTQTSKDQSGGSFRLSAQITYDVDWTCTGACLAGAGTLGQVQGPPGTGALRVLQRQTVVTQ